jgi:hypothetical protein
MVCPFYKEKREKPLWTMATIVILAGASPSSCYHIDQVMHVARLTSVHESREHSHRCQYAAVDLDDLVIMRSPSLAKCCSLVAIVALRSCVLLAVISCKSPGLGGLAR